MSSALDPRIDAYIADAAPFAQPILQHLRRLIHQGCSGVTETIKWSMPSFEYAGKILCHLAAFKAHCAFGFWHQGMEKIMKNHDRGGPAMGGFGRVTALKDLPSDATLLRYIRAAAKLNESGAPGRPRAAGGAPKKELPVPADLAEALRRNKTAANTFEKFSPSHRKEYVQWIAEAKRSETREKRLATTLEWLAEGKPRNWKYLNC